jgi:hypothetical protein
VPLLRKQHALEKETPLLRKQHAQKQLQSEEEAQLPRKAVLREEKQLKEKPQRERAALKEKPQRERAEREKQLKEEDKQSFL